MHVTCPSCRARYAVDPAEIGAAGRTVQCSRCGYRWRERAVSVAPVLPPPAPPPRAVPGPGTRPDAGAAPPVVDERGRKGPSARWLVAALLLIVATGGLFLAFRSDLGNALPAAWRPYLPFGAASGG
ncbi:MAG: zinc-ribbon domain-containing protein [Pseudomonadota bacterium]